MCPYLWVLLCVTGMIGYFFVNICPLEIEGWKENLSLLQFLFGIWKFTADCPSSPLICTILTLLVQITAKSDYTAMKAWSGPAFWQLVLTMKTRAQCKVVVCGSDKNCGIYFYFLFFFFASLESGCHQNELRFFHSKLGMLSCNQWLMGYHRETENEKRHLLPVIEQSDVLSVCNLCKSGFCLCDFSLLLQLLWGKSGEICAQRTVGKDLIWQNRRADLISILCERHLASLLSCNMALCWNP